MVRKLVGEDLNELYAMKVLKKVCQDICFHQIKFICASMAVLKFEKFRSMAKSFVHI